MSFFENLLVLCVMLIVLVFGVIFFLGMLVVNHLFNAWHFLMAQSMSLKNTLRKKRQLRIWWKWLNYYYYKIRGVTSPYAIICSGRQEALDETLCREEIDLKEKTDLIVDVSVVTHNSSVYLKALCESLLRQDFSTKQLHLIFVDNGSSDDTLKQLQEFESSSGELFYQVTIVPLVHNVGFGRGHNQAFEHALGDFFLIVNPDLEFERDSIANVVKHALSDDLDRVASWELRQKPFEHPKIYDPITLKTFWSSAACLLVNPKAFRAVGGFEPRIFLYGEDVELSFRLIDNGWQIKYCPSAVVWHYTYSEAAEFKPAQFEGSILASGLLKLRYGGLTQKLMSVLQYPALYCFVVKQTRSFRDRKLKLILSAYCTYFKNVMFFLKERTKSRVHFPFNKFDYSINRRGAFYEHRANLDRERGLVSIVMRTHGDQLFWLRESIASVLNQTYQHIELIIVEDGGDHAKVFAEKIKQKSKRCSIKYYSLDKVGRSSAGNYGLEQASGDFIMFLDSDDYLFAEHVEVLVDELEADQDIDLAYSLAWSIPTEVKDTTCLDKGYNEVCFQLPEGMTIPFCKKALEQGNLFPIQAAVFRRAAYEKCGGFDTRLEYLEDWNLWLRYSHYFSFKMIPKLTSSYRMPANPVLLARRIELFNDAAKDSLNNYYQSINV